MVSHFVRLDTVVTTVDAINGIRQVEEYAEAVKQAALADRLLLTKADLAAVVPHMGIPSRENLPK
jgi:G3E family GTPase